MSETILFCEGDPLSSFDSYIRKLQVWYYVRDAKKHKAVQGQFISTTDNQTIFLIDMEEIK